MLHSRLLRYLDEVVPPGLDPQGGGPAQCRVVGDQSANSGAGERAWRADFRAHAAAPAADRDRRSSDRPCARYTEGPSAGRSADRGAEGSDPRRSHHRHHEWARRRSAAALSQQHSRPASARACARLRVLPLDQMTNAVLTGEADLALTYNPPTSPGLRVVASHDLPLGAVVSPKHPLDQAPSAAAGRLRRVSAGDRRFLDDDPSRRRSRLHPRQHSAASDHRDQFDRVHEEDRAQRPSHHLPQSGRRRRRRRGRRNPPLAAGRTRPAIRSRSS